MENARTHCSTTEMVKTDIDAFRRRLGDAVQIRRKSGGLTQEQLAEATDSSTEWISQVERGIGMPSLELLLRLAQALDASPAELVQAASSPSTGRPTQQELFVTLDRLGDRDLGILLAAARAMAVDRA